MKKTGISVAVFARSTERELLGRIQALSVAIGEAEDIDRKMKLTRERDRLEQKRTNIQELTKGNT